MLEDSDSEADDLMQSQMQLILTQFCSKKRKQIVPDSLPCSRKSRAGVSLLRRDAWGSIFGLDTLMNPHMESVRKDAECTFGILKKRCRILKNHMLIHNKARIDNVVFTCAIFT